MSNKHVLTLTGGRGPRVWWRSWWRGWHRCDPEGLKEAGIRYIWRFDPAPIRSYYAQRGRVGRLRRWDYRAGEYRRIGE